MNHFLKMSDFPKAPPQQPATIHNIETGQNSRKINSIIHSAKDISDFHDNVLSQVHKRDYNGREIHLVTKSRPLEK